MKYALKKVVGVRHYDGGTMKHKFTLSDIKNAQLTGNSELVYAEGADGAKLAAFDINKVAGFNCQNGALDTGAIAAQVGSEGVVKVASGNEILIRQEIEVDTVTSGSATITLKGAPANGASGVKLVAKGSSSGTPDGVIFDYTTETIAEGKYTISDNTITIKSTDLAKGDLIFVDYYPTITNYEKIVNEADKFTETGLFIVDAWFTDLCTDTDVPMQLVLEKGKMTGEIDYTFGDQVAVQKITIEAMYNACRGSSKALWKMFTYDEANIVAPTVE